MSRSTRFQFTTVRSFFLGVIIGGATIAALVPIAQSANQVQSLKDYTQLLDKTPLLFAPEEAAVTKALMARMMAAHHRQGSEAEIAELADSYAWVAVSEAGYQERASGKDIVAQMTRNLYASDYMKDYMGAKAQPIAIVGNIGVQLEHENFRDKTGNIKTTTALNIYEVRQGKLLRLWAFMPTAADH